MLRRDIYYQRTASSFLARVSIGIAPMAVSTTSPFLIIRKLGFLAKPDDAVNSAGQDVSGWYRALSGVKADVKLKNKVYKFQKTEKVRNEIMRIFPYNRRHDDSR